ncbi:MAG: ubiquitin-like domain-containing protein [Ideonella sp.]|nr:ubiquitin-like domain-containing protein [Ideonella sp.]
MTQRILGAIFCLALTAALSACGGGTDEQSGTRAFVAQIATQAAPERRALGTEQTLPQASAAATALPTADETLDWAEYKYPSLFPKGPQSFPLQHLGISYTVREYKNGNYLGITASGGVFGLGPFTGNVLQGFGNISDYAAQIRADATPLRELLVDGDEADADVGVEVLRSFKPATITTQVNPSIGGQTVYEVSGTTPKGVPFKAVLLGDEGLDLSGFKGQMRVQARLRQIQGQTVLAGRLLPRNAASGLNPIAFVAGGVDVNFAGPAAGTVYQLRGAAEFKGTCGDDGLSGSYSLKQDTVEVTGAMTGVREPGQPLACAPGAVEHADLPISLSYTAVQTHMGIVFSFQGSLNAASATARNTILAAGRGTGIQATQVQSAMPAQGLTVASPSLPASTLRATATLKTNVKQLGGTSGAELVSFNASTGTLIFNRLAGNLSSLVVNDIISSAPRTAAPNGFLRKVTRIQNTNDGKVEVRTAKTNVADLLDEADISVDQPFDSVDVQRAAAMERGHLLYAAAQARPASTKIVQNFNLVLYDQDGNPNTTDDQVTVSGSFKVQPRVVVDFRCRRAFCSDPYFLGKFVLDEDAEITVSAKLKKELRESQRIARIPLPPITAGPLVFVPDIVVTVDLKGSVHVEVQVGATQSLHLEAGVKYDSGFSKINVVDTSVGITGPTFEGSVEAKAGITAALRLMLYGVAGVSAEAGPYVKFEAQYPGTPAWTMRYGIEGNLGVDIDLLILSKDWDIKLFDKVFDDKTKVAPNDRPKFLEIGSKYLCDDGYSARIGVGLNGALAPVRLYALTDDKEDGAGSGTIDWSSSLDGSLGRTRKADRHEISASLRNGTHTITAVLSDSGNPAATRTREFTVQLAGNRCQFPGGLPSVDITSNDNAFVLAYVDTDGSLTLRARSAVGVTPICGSVTWKSNLESRDAGTSTGALELINEGGLFRQVCNHTFTHVYKHASPQTITAKFAYGGMTATDSIDVGALMPLSPSLGDVQFTAPSGTRYIYEGDQVSFNASGSNPVWSSSVPEDNINGLVGNNVNGRFNSIGQRTVVARYDDGHGGFVSKNVTVNVLSALARP